MKITPEEYCNNINKANEKYGNKGVLMVLKVIEVLEEMENKKKITSYQEKGKTYYQLTGK